MCRSTILSSSLSAKLTKPVYLISDLHLDSSRPLVVELFADFLKRSIVEADALYILGDLFEVWVGDDDDSEFSHTIIAELKKTTDNGLPIFIMRGNRDFLLDTAFEKQSGCQLIEDPSVITLADQPILLLHGDTLCTDDIKYQQFRQHIQSDAMRQQLMSKSLDERREIAKQARQYSLQATRNNPQAIMDVNEQSVIDQFRQHQVGIMIHGHTHRLKRHEHQVDNKTCERYVLGDWHDDGNFLEIDSVGIRFHSITA